MTPIKITKGLDIPLAGKPEAMVRDFAYTGPVAVYQEVEGLKAKVEVKEGDAVQRGTPLFFDKKMPDLHFCSPITGRVKAIEYGARRALYRILIEPTDETTAVNFKSHSVQELLGLDREPILSALLQSGLLSLIKQRPFSRIANPDVTPKAIFVNGMNTAPFGADLSLAVQGAETAFQAGLNALTRLTDGAVHVCLAPPSPATPKALTDAEQVKIHYFEGPHPSGNTSVHIHHIDPMLPHDQVWAVKGVDLLRIGHLFLTGEYPHTKCMALGGPGVKEEARAHYRVPIGTPLSALLDDRVAEGEQRLINGDILSGQQVMADEHVRSAGTALNVVPEGGEQHFMGWLAPGINKFSTFRTYLSGWFGHKRKWNLNTSLNGSYRPMVLTGLYDRYVPLNLMVDFLLRAVLARDTDEAIQLGILETDPEDFALCSFVCPSKVDVCGIIKQGLREIEEEGI